MSRNGTLYMLSKSRGYERQLVLCDCEINGGYPVFLDIGNYRPVSLFGGFPYSAAIGSEGEVIFINPYALKHSSNLHIGAVSLPGGDKASSVSFCDSLVFVLSQNGRVFLSNFDFSSSLLKFSAVSELSGTYDHCLAVSREC